MSAEPIQSARGNTRIQPVAAPAFSATRCEVSGALHVVLAGELDLATVPAAEQELHHALEEASPVLLDLRALTFIDVAGLHMILTADRSAREAGRQLVVVHQRAGCIYRMFELTRADRSLELVEAPAVTPTSRNGSGPRPI